jgi:hypothetical protein
MSEHTRKPELLGYDAFLRWSQVQLLPWLTEHLADADFPTHIVGDLTDLTAKIDDYEVKLGPYLTLIDLAKARNDLYGTAFKSVYAKLKQIKIALPTVANEPDVLALFNLVKLPKTLDALYITAKNALAYWATVAALPKYAPMIPDFTTLTALFADFETARENFYSTDSDRETAQNEVLAAREAIHVIERGAFNWYRSRHIDGQDEFWTDTPWGCTSGGEEEGETGEPFPAAPQNFAVTHNEMPSMNNLSWNKLTGAAKFNIGRAVTLIGEPEPSLVLWMSEVEGEAVIDPDAASGKSYYYQVTGVDAGNVEGKRSVVVRIDVV